MSAMKPWRMAVNFARVQWRETRPHPFQRRLRRQSFAGRSGTGEKRLNLPQLLARTHIVDGRARKVSGFTKPYPQFE
jgi:hypothetical protein